MSKNNNGSKDNIKTENKKTKGKNLNRIFGLSFLESVFNNHLDDFDIKRKIEHELVLYFASIFKELYKHCISNLVDRWNKVLLEAMQIMLMIRYFYSKRFFIYNIFSKIGHYIYSNLIQAKYMHLITKTW